MLPFPFFQQQKAFPKAAGGTEPQWPQPVPERPCSTSIHSSAWPCFQLQEARCVPAAFSHGTASAGCHKSSCYSPDWTEIFSISLFSSPLENRVQDDHISFATGWGCGRATGQMLAGPGEKGLFWIKINFRFVFVFFFQALVGGILKQCPQLLVI